MYTYRIFIYCGRVFCLQAGMCLLLILQGWNYFCRGFAALSDFVNTNISCSSHLYGFRLANVTFLTS